MRYEKPFINVRFTTQIFELLKRFFQFFFYLYIYTSFWSLSTAQNLTLKIEAEKVLSEGFLDSLNTSYNFENYINLKAAVDSLSKNLQRNGYIDSKLNAIVKKNDSLFIADFFLGKQWKEIEVHYSKNDFSISEIKKISNNVQDSVFTIPIKYLDAALEKLNGIKAENGDPFNKLQLSEIEKIDDKTLKAILNVTTSKQRNIDRVVVKGYDKFPKSFLKYYAGIKKGKVFNQKKVVEQNSIINNLGFVNSLKPPEALFKKDSTIIYMYLQKENNNLFDGILGFATNEDTQKIEFNGYLNLELNNNLNYGEQLSINYKADGREQQNLRVFTKLPYLFKSPVGVSLELEIFKRDSTFSTTHQQARVYYQASPKIDFYVGYKSYESNNLLDEANVSSFVEDYNSKFFLGGIHYTKLQNQKLFPIKTFLGLESEIGNRSTSSTDDKQLRLSGTFSHIFNLNEKNSVFLKNNTNFLNSASYLTNELYRFGGINSIRGFLENSIDASLSSVLNTEYRYLLDGSSFVHSIIDVAYFENEILNIQEELFGFGVGLGLNTKAGLFKFNIANGLSKNQNIEFANTKVHIIYLTRF